MKVRMFPRIYESEKAPIAWRDNGGVGVLFDEGPNLMMDREAAEALTVRLVEILTDGEPSRRFVDRCTALLRRVEQVDE